jgi:serine/threonine-protein kinase
VELLSQRTTAPAPSVSTVCPELNPALDAPILRMLEKDPERRPQSIAQAYEELHTAAQGAGYPVSSLPAPASSPSASGPLSPARSRPGRTAIAEAATLADGQTRSVPDARTTGSSSRAPWKLLAGGGALAVAALVAAVVARSGDDESSSPDAPSAAPAAVTAPPPVEPKPVLSAPPAIAPVPQKVELTFDASPRDAEVFLGEERIGSASEPIRLPRSDEPVTLRIEAKGYRPQTVSVHPKQNAVVPVTLEKLRATTSTRPAKKKTSGDLEF